MTVGELAHLLKGYDDSTQVYIHTGDDYRIAALDDFTAEEQAVYTTSEGKHCLDLTGAIRDLHDAIVLDPISRG